MPLYNQAASSVGSVAAADTSIVVGGTAGAPTVATGTLDVIAADHPPAADWSNNSVKITGLASGVAVTDAANYGQVLSASPWLPSDSGWLAYNADPGIGTYGFAIPTGNTVYLMRVNIRQAMSITNVILYLDVVASGGTSSQNFAGLYAGTTAGAYTAGQRIGTTADQTSAWAANAATYHVMALSGGPYAVPAGFVWVAFVWNGGTGPSFAQPHENQTGSANSGVTASTARSATNGTGTSLPGSITPSSNSLTFMWWAGVS